MEEQPQDQMATASSVIAEAICKQVDEFKAVVEKEKDSGLIDSQVTSEAASILIEKVTSIIKSSLESKGEPTKRRDTKEDTSAPFFTQTPEQKVFSNSLIVKLIFGFLDHVDLLYFRLVSTLWKREATSLLLSPSFNELFKVGFVWSESNQTYQNFIGTLEEFHQEFSVWISKGLYPVCTQFSFIGGDLSSSSSSLFFTEHGSHIQSLIYKPQLDDNFSIPHFLVTLQKLLTEWAPKIKNLTLLSIPPTGEDLSSLPQGTQLPSLEKFIVRRSLSDPEALCPIVQDILKAAPNFKPFRRLNFKFTREIIASGKFHMFKELPIDVNLSNEHHRHLWSQYIEAGPRLQKLDIQILPNKYDRGYAANLAREVDALLQSTRETLEEILNLKNYKFCSIIKFPVLEKVTRISCGKTRTRSSGDEWKILDNEQNLSDVFPNLRFLDCQSYNPLFDPANSSPSIRELLDVTIIVPEEEANAPRYRGRTVLSAMENVSIFYPSLKIFQVTVEIHEFPKLSKIIWLNLRGLEQLYITLDPSLPPNPPFDIVEKIESCITGISPEICRQLRRNGSWTKADDSIINNLLQQLENEEENMESNPSLRNMTKLKKLAFKFYEGWPVLTHLSYFYAFELMAVRQNLEVSVNGRLFSRDFHWEKQVRE